MHVHLRDLDGTLPLFIVNGVTTVRDMGSELQNTMAMREQIEAGTLVGPRIKTSGMMVESSSWVAQYVELMREQGADETRRSRSSCARGSGGGPAGGCGRLWIR